MCVDNPVQLAYLLGLQEKLMYKQNDFVIGKNKKLQSIPT